MVPHFRKLPHTTAKHSQAQGLRSSAEALSFRLKTATPTTQRATRVEDLEFSVIFLLGAPNIINYTKHNTNNKQYY